MIWAAGLPAEWVLKLRVRIVICYFYFQVRLVNLSVHTREFHTCEFWFSSMNSFRPRRHPRQKMCFNSLSGGWYVLHWYNAAIYTERSIFSHFQFLSPAPRRPPPLCPTMTFLLNLTHVGLCPLSSSSIFLCQGIFAMQLCLNQGTPLHARIG